MTTPATIPASDENEDAFLPLAPTITVIDVGFANRDDCSECHSYDSAGNHVGVGRLDGNFAESTIARLPELTGHPDQALVARALTAKYRDGSSSFRVLGIAHRSVEALNEYGPPMPAMLSDELGPEVLGAALVDELGVETYGG